MYEAHEIEVATQADRDIDEARERLTPEPLFTDEEAPEPIGPRARAIQAGQLRDVTPIARAVGYRCAFALTPAAWAAFAEVPPIVIAARRGMPAFTVPRGAPAVEPRARGWRRSRKLAAKAAQAGRERRRVRLLLRAMRAAGDARTSITLHTEIGPIRVDVESPDRFDLAAFSARGELVQLVATAGEGDEGEMVGTIRTRGES